MGKQGRLKNREIREKKIRAEKIKKKKEWTAKTSANLSQICSWKFTKDGALGWKGGMDVKKAEKWRRVQQFTIRGKEGEDREMGSNLGGLEMRFCWMEVLDG